MTPPSGWIGGQGNVHFFCIYPNLFRITTDPLISVSRAVGQTALLITFTRQLTGVMLSEWNQLQSTISYSSVFTDITKPDIISWSWTSAGQFTVHSLYIWLEYGGIKNTTYTTLWKTDRKSTRLNSSHAQ